MTLRSSYKKKKKNNIKIDRLFKYIKIKNIQSGMGISWKDKTRQDNKEISITCIRMTSFVHHGSRNKKLDVIKKHVKIT